VAGAWRAVFLRVHPTGKPVLSLSTESDGQEAQYAQIVSDELGIAAADVKVVANDLDRFGEGHGFGTSPSQGTANAIRNVCGKIKQKGQILAGGMLGTSPQSLTWTGDRFAPGRDPSQGKRIEEIALYAHGGALELPAGLDGSLDAQTAYRD
jgi:carbon-monoxide dehydrogenase large subunit